MRFCEVGGTVNKTKIAECRVKPRPYEPYVFETSYIYYRKKWTRVHKSGRKWAMIVLNCQNNGQYLRDWEQCTTPQQSCRWAGSKPNHKEHKAVLSLCYSMFSLLLFVTVRHILVSYQFIVLSLSVRSIVQATLPIFLESSIYSRNPCLLLYELRLRPKFVECRPKNYFIHLGF